MMFPFLKPSANGLKKGPDRRQQIRPSWGGFLCLLLRLVGFHLPGLDPIGQDLFAVEIRYPNVKLHPERGGKDIRLIIREFKERLCIPCFQDNVRPS
jgi:hypothetical protein